MGTLHALLDQGLAYDAEFGQGLSNHLPMALVALHRLGASQAQLQHWARGYLERVGLKQARRGTWPAGDAWTARLGRPGAAPAYLDLFNQWLAHEGSSDMLQQVLPALLPGCAAMAFHGLIRTAYALQAGHAGELAAGLAHWAARHLPLGAMPEVHPTTDDPETLLRRLKAGTSRARLIAQRMADAARSGAVNRVVAPLRVDEQTPQRLAEAAAMAYAHSGSFTALHLVTATHAMRVVAPRAPEPLQAWRWHWQALAHGVVAASLKPAAAVPLLAWDDIVARALASPDEHVVKLVDSAREEERAYAGATHSWWRAAASRAVAGAVQGSGSSLKP